jgi:hypothetical protein
MDVMEVREVIQNKVMWYEKGRGLQYKMKCTNIPKTKMIWG